MEPIDPFEIVIDKPPGTKIIAFAGSAQVGKDESANVAESWLCANGFSYDRRAFADQLKQYCVVVLGLDPKELWGTDQDKNKLTKYLWNNLPMNIRWKHSTNHKRPDGSEYQTIRTGPMSNRDILNIAGTDIHRAYFGDDIWINALFNKDFSQEDVLIITDVRTLEEVNAVKERGGLIVKITRNTGRIAEHEIQQRLDKWQDFDYHYDNNGSLEDLNKYIKKILNEVFCIV